MPQKRSELREKTMIILYQREIMKRNNIDYDIENIIKENIDIENEFVKEMVYGVITAEEDLITMANKYLKNWTIDRLDIAGACILKLGIYELINTETPQIVIINEAINLAKKYSDDDVRKIINACLDRIMKENER